MKTYSVKESAVLLSISTRAVQKRCKKGDIKKNNNKYLITQDDIDKWIIEIKSKDPEYKMITILERGRKRRKYRNTQLENKSLKKENESLKLKLSELKDRHFEAEIKSEDELTEDYIKHCNKIYLDRETPTGCHKIWLEKSNGKGAVRFIKIIEGRDPRHYIEWFIKNTRYVYGKVLESRYD